MATLLMIIIYIAFISLGIPDSLLGSAWPVMYQELNLPISYASVISTLTCAGTVISSLVSAPMIRRLGTGRVTALCTALTASALFGFSISHNLFWLCLFAVPLGFGGGSIDVALNNYVALHYGPTCMSLLHCFYGVGVSISPFLMSLALSEAMDWRRGYRTMFFIQAIIALICILALPLWKKAGKDSADEETLVESPGIFTLLKQHTVRISCCIFICSCAMEAVGLVWGSTFLVKVKGFTEDTAAALITFYFIGLTFGRLLSGILNLKMKVAKVTTLGQYTILAAMVILFLPLPRYAAVAGLFLVGMGNGPVYPNISYLTPQVFGKERSQAVIGIQMAMSYVGFMLAPILFGQIAERISVKLFVPYLALLFAILFFSIKSYFKNLPASER